MTKLTPGPDNQQKRVIVIVLDGSGVGALPDADIYGDQGANTLKHVIEKHQPLKLKNLFSLGLAAILKLKDAGNITLIKGSSYGRMQPLSPGKDTTSGHWELAGLILDQPFPLFPQGFPHQVIEAFEKAIGRQTLGNVAASGTEIIKELGAEHVKTGFPIVYTSADSVFQIAAHEKVVPRETLYQWCKKARNILTGDYAVGRVIARPFIGEDGAYQRTAGRHDYSLEPPGETLLDQVKDAGYPVAVIGKVADIFAHRGITEKRPGGNNTDINGDLEYFLDSCPTGLLWATFGDFDTVYGHRNDSAGFAEALEEFDLKLAGILNKIKNEDLLLITADHGCDPTFPTTDHTREYVPIIAWSPGFTGAGFEPALGTRRSYADLAATAAAWLNLEHQGKGKPFNWFPKD
jgi:phosphopentomutase